MRLSRNKGYYLYFVVNFYVVVIFYRRSDVRTLELLGFKYHIFNNNNNNNQHKILLTHLLL